MDGRPAVQTGRPKSNCDAVCRIRWMPRNHTPAKRRVQAPTDLDQAIAALVKAIGTRANLAEIARVAIGPGYVNLHFVDNSKWIGFAEWDDRGVWPELVWL